MDTILKVIAESNEEESKVILKAAIKRRESFLNGGEIIYAEYSKKQIEEFERILHQADKMLEKE